MPTEVVCGGFIDGLLAEVSLLALDTTYVLKFSITH